MDFGLGTPRATAFDAAVAALRTWQSDDAPMQLHPGDLGWYRRFGAETAAADVRTWSRDGRILAVGLLDGPDLLRVTTAPEARDDQALARRIAADLADPERGVLPAGSASVEAPAGTLHEVLGEEGWAAGEPWTPLQRDLTDPVEDAGVRIEVAGPGLAEERAAVHRAAFEGSKFSAEHWLAMAAGTAYADARCLLAYDDAGNAVAAVTVWAAGPGRPGLIEPMGVHEDHRGRGYGKAICVAGADALRGLGSSSAIVCTPSSLTGAVATYASAGFRPLPERLDRCRE
ncbi:MULTISPECIES: GNAT family N-acetyltransferase [Glycomyces]|uniref:GNAT superfamily N-acetyltransferase n=2 Tax=Glycomyces TaxID=58113 RepID=A0ABU2ATK2_9ACTN|nr:GNAT family N-acetyltransferase [Glycomyces lechevalierae]MDR7340544.1 GNAT superfamily N-acetyltransferase [Glycomyces lechevalierae]